MKVRDTYQAGACDDVYAVGIAAAFPVPWQTLTPLGIPKTGFPTERAAHVATKNVERAVPSSRSTRSPTALRSRAGDLVVAGIRIAFAVGDGQPLALSTTALVGHGAGATVGAALLAALGVTLNNVRSQLSGNVGLLIRTLILESAIALSVRLNALRWQGRPRE